MTITEPERSVLLAESCIPVLETERLVLRAPRFEDVPAVAELANNRKIAEMTANLPYPYRHSDAHAFVETLGHAADGTTFAIFLKQEGALAFVGMCGYGQRAGEQAPEIGYWIGEPHWGRGIATEAARAVIDYAFSETSITQLLGSARVVNPRSRRILEKCGFQWSGVGLCRVKALGASVPVDRFQLDRGIWASLRQWGMTAMAHRRGAH